MQHTMQVKSLHDFNAVCTCGNWEMIHTGPATQDVQVRAEEEFQRHQLNYTPKPLNLKQWRGSLRSGRQMLCTYRWYWDQATENPDNFKPAPKGGQLCTILKLMATQLIYSTPDAPRCWMHFPKASELKATESGFEFYFPDTPGLRDPANGPIRAGKLMSRYEWLS